jgi:uncharacterized membrane protein
MAGRPGGPLVQAALVVAALWLAFGASHLLLSSRRLRPRLVATLGQRGFLGVYSLLALAIFVPLVAFYFGHKHTGPPLWALGGSLAVRWTTYALMGMAFGLVVAGLARPSPASLARGRPVAAGALRVTRHPLLMGFGLFGLAHLLSVSVYASDLAFFAGFPIFAVVGCAHQDRRKLADGGPEFRRFHAATPFLPFSRPAGLPAALREDAVPIALGIGAAVAVRWFHPMLFG